MVVMTTPDMQAALLPGLGICLLADRSVFQNTSATLLRTFLEYLLSEVCHRMLLALLQSFSFLLISNGDAATSGKLRGTNTLYQPSTGNVELVRCKMEAASVEENDLTERCKARSYEAIEGPCTVDIVCRTETSSWILAAKNKDGDEDDEDEDEEDDDEDEYVEDEDDDGEGGDEEEEEEDGGAGGDGGDADKNQEDDDAEDDEEGDYEEDEDDEDIDEESSSDEDEAPPKKMKK